MRPDLQTRRFRRLERVGVRRDVQQVPHALVVDLDHGHLHLGLLFRVFAEPREDLAARLGHDALRGRVAAAHHGVRLTAARLSVGEQAHVVPAPRVLQDVRAHAVEDVLLGRERRVRGRRVVRPEGVIERERLLVAGDGVDDGGGLVGHAQDARGAELLLAGVERSASHRDANVAAAAWEMGRGRGRRREA